MRGERGVCIQGLLCLPGRGRGSLLTPRDFQFSAGARVSVTG